jgi:hypothetical protein|tara:strand:+ start:856 stop:1092 length:237 start_codon:yes stop_codon:yes gene_type:complete
VTISRANIPREIKMSKKKKDKNWIQKAIKKPGSLRKSLGIKKGETIPVSTLTKLAKGKGLNARRARLALTLKKIKGRA